MRRIFRWLVALVAFGIPTSALGDELDDFVIAGDDFTDFAPAVRPSATATWGPRVFVAGSGPPLDPILQNAMIIAMDKRSGAEVWRVSTGEPERRDFFDLVAVDAGRVCAVGRGVEGFPLPSLLLVGCYEAATGAPLWERQFATDQIRLSIISIRLSGTALVISISRGFGSQVLLFDARDGS